MTNYEYIEQKEHEDSINGKLAFRMPTILSHVFSCDLFFENMLALENNEHCFSKWKEKNPTDYEAIKNAYMAYRDAINEHCWNKEKNW